MPTAITGAILALRGGEMHDWSWFWMSVAMTGWIVVLGLVVYVAVRLGSRPARHDDV